MPRAPFHLPSVKALLAAHGEMQQGKLAAAADLSVGTLIAAVKPGLRSGEILDRREGRAVFYRLAERQTVVGLPPAQPSATVNGFVPKPMVVPRPGSDVRLPSRAPGPAPAAAREPGAEAAADARVVASPTPSPAPKPRPEPAAPAPEPQLSTERYIERIGVDAEPEREAANLPFNACRYIDGSIIVVGVEVREDGAILFTPDQAASLWQLRPAA